MIRILGGLFLGGFTLALALAAGCGTYTPPVTGKADLDMPPPTDLGDPSDQAMVAGPDMVTTLPVPAGCNTQTVVTGTQAYTTLTTAANTRCMGGNCHNNSIKPLFSTQATFMAATINQASTATMPYVTPNSPDKSYILYKLRGLQATVRNGGGAQMPRGGTPLTTAESCTMYNWVLHGAPAN